MYLTFTNLNELKRLIKLFVKLNLANLSNINLPIKKINYFYFVTITSLNRLPIRSVPANDLVSSCLQNYIIYSIGYSKLQCNQLLLVYWRLSFMHQIWYFCDIYGAAVPSFDDGGRLPDSDCQPSSLQFQDWGCMSFSWHWSSFVAILLWVTQIFLVFIFSVFCFFSAPDELFVGIRLWHLDSVNN